MHEKNRGSKVNLMHKCKLIFLLSHF
uniref:Uncharacterized protein n=1 Tax=Rhizophora mucronata TaxID=61149 RepID=A0A2P2PPS4_RHIMU